MTGMTIRRHPRHPRGIAMLLVLISMATAMTLVMGWLAAQDNSALVGSNAIRAAEARAVAHTGLETAAAVLESEAPWQTTHDDGWILRDHPMCDGHVDVRLFDDLTDAPPTTASSVIRIETVGRIGTMSQKIVARATVHPFDDQTLGDLSGYAIFAGSELDIRGDARIRSWRDSGRGPRAVATGGDWSIRGRAARDIDGGDLRLYDSSADEGARGVLPQELGPLGLDLVDTPVIAAPDDDASMIILRQHVVEDTMPMHVEGDLILRPHARLILRGDHTLTVSGQLHLEPGSAIEVAPGAKVTIAVAGDVQIRKAVIGVHQHHPPRGRNWRQSDIDWSHPARIRLVSSGASQATWQIRDQSLIQGVIEAPTARIHMERSAVLGRIAADEVRLRRHARLYFDHRTDSVVGLATLTDLVEGLDLFDRRDGGLDDGAAEDVLDRLVDLLGRPRGQGISTPSDGWWVHRPVPVECQLEQFAGDTGTWEAAALAAMGTP